MKLRSPVMKHAAWWGSVLFTIGNLSRPAVVRAAEADAGRAKDSRGFGSRGSWSVLLEHLASVSYHRFSFPAGQGGESPVQHSVLAEAFQPDVAVDAFVTDHLSLGGRVSYSGGSTTSSGPSDTRETTHAVQVYPRIGLACSFPSRFGVWAQASIGVGSEWTFLSQTAPAGSSTSHSQSGAVGGGLTLLGTYSPLDHVVLTAGPWVVTDLARFGDAYMRDATPFGFSLGAGVYL